jgi:hypothetical protein
VAEVQSQWEAMRPFGILAQTPIHTKLKEILKLHHSLVANGW